MTTAFGGGERIFTIFGGNARGSGSDRLGAASGRGAAGALGLEGAAGGLEFKHPIREYEQSE